MADKSLAPGYIKITYTGVLFPHHQVLPIVPGAEITIGSEPNVVTKGGDEITMTEAVADFLSHYKKFFPAAVHFGNSELHTVDAETGEDQFIYGLDAGVVGTNVTARVAMQSAVLTMKDANGALTRLYFMEGSDAANQKFLPPFDDVPNTDELAAWLVSSDGWVVGRGNFYPFSAVSYITKFNDALRKQQGKA